jgi:SAM-dependent methyltransferase
MIYKIIKECRICFSKNLVTIIDLKDQPPANSLRSSIKKKLIKIPLKLLFCRSCKTLQISATVDPKFLFEQYVWVSGTSKVAKEYANKFSSRLIRRFKKKGPSVLEIASNDGTFLKPFKEKYNCEVLGVDPAKNIGKIANKSGIKTLVNFFNYNTALNISKNYQNFDIIFARNVIPHVKNIHEIIKSINLLLDNDGIVAIEFHYAKIILDELHYDSIYHEHLFYFTIKTLSDLFAKYKLFAFDVDKSPISGGSLVLYFSKLKRKKSHKLIFYLNIENKNNINSLEKVKKFSYSATKHSKKFYDLINKNSKKKKIIAYGASARSSTLLNFSRLNNKQIDFILDKNPLKHNKYTPGSNILIKNPVKKIKEILKEKIILILSWNFKKEICNDLKLIGYKGKFIIPLPNKINIE